VLFRRVERQEYENPDDILQKEGKKEAADNRDGTINRP
jgi:hypothetical protein